MKRFFRTLFSMVFLVLSVSGCEQNKHKLTEESFLGKWYTVKGDVESYSFLKDDSSYIFVGILGMHPVAYGTWKIKKDKFIITMDNGISIPNSFTLSDDTLIFNQGKEIYTRTTPVEVKNPEARILTTLAGDLSTLKFSAPVPDDVTGKYRTDGSGFSQSFSIKGYSITAVTSHSSGAVLEIADFLKEYGFDQDTLYYKENCYCFRDNNQIVTICETEIPQSIRDSVYIQITTGLLKK
jgi:hypothetical protein